MKRFEGQLVVVTGGSKGIGKAIVKKFLDEGATVINIARTVDVLEETCKSFNTDKVIAFPMDVSVREDWDRLVAYIKEHFDGLDVLVNNAAITNPAKTIVTATDDDWERVVATDLKGPFYGMRACYEVLKKGIYAGIVNIGSIAGLIVSAGSGNDVAYQSSKMGLRQMTKHAALNLAPDCIRVNIIHPGGVKTPMVEEWAASQGLDLAEVMKGVHPMPPHYSLPEEVADAVLFLADRKAARAITGTELNVDSGASLL